MSQANDGAGSSGVWVAAAAWATILAVSCVTVGYASFSARLGLLGGWASGGSAAGGPALGGPALGGWASGPAVGGFAGWLGCEAITSAVLARSRQPGPGRCGLRWLASLSPRNAVLTGAVGCAGGLMALGLSPSPDVGLALYAVTAGIGAGLVYSTCGRVAAGEIPGHPRLVWLISGACGCAAIPVAVLVAQARDLPNAFGALAWVILLVSAVCAPVLRPAPPRAAPRAGEPPCEVPPREPVRG
jgi:hypothetical protein